MSYLAPGKRYREAEILTAPPARLLIITYDALLAALARARMGITMQQHEMASGGFARARALLGELLATLDRRNGGELADRLASIYAFLLSELDSVALRGDVTRLERHAGLIRELRDAFAEIAPAGAVT